MDAVVTIADTLLDEVMDQDADLSIPEAEPHVPVVELMTLASRVSEYLR